MKKFSAVAFTLLISGYGLFQIYKVANQECLSVTYKTFEGLACGIEGYMQGSALVALGFVVGSWIWLYKNNY